MADEGSTTARERLARKTMVTAAGKAGGSHSYNDEEKVAFTEHINNCLGSDPFLVEHGYVPMDPASSDLFKRINDGVLLCKLINQAQADTVDERALNLPAAGKKDMNLWEKQENNNIVINSAKSIGCQVRTVESPPPACPCPRFRRILHRSSTFTPPTSFEHLMTTRSTSSWVSCGRSLSSSCSTRYRLQSAQSWCVLCQI
jgi:hypothetical protein